MATPGELLAGRYRVLDRLGSGGMATVHRGHDERLDRDVAIKILLPNLAHDPATAARFEREARSLAAASHPGVVSVYDVDPGDPASGREPFFVMELCPGGSLADRLAGGRRMSPDDLVPILVSVVDGLADLHGRGIVHRDVKPQNILFASDRAKLADFGLAQASDAAGLSDLTAPGTAVGTLAFLAPEILAGDRATAAADVYALGVVAFVALSGGSPRPAGSMAELVSAAQTPARRISEAAPELGSALDDPIASALGIRPEDRPDALRFGSSLTTALGRWTRDGGRERLLSAGAPVRDVDPPLPLAEPRAADEATTAVGLPLADTAMIPAGSRRPSGRSAARDEAPRRRGRATLWLLPATAIVATLAAILIIATGLAGLGGGSTATTASPSAVAASSSPQSSASVSPSVVASPSGTLTAAPSPSSDPALAALDAVDAAISGARGGPNGLKGKDANDLEALAGAVRRALAADDRTAALDDARKLDHKVAELSDHIGRDQAARLTAATAELVQVLGG